MDRFKPQQSKSDRDVGARIDAFARRQKRSTERSSSFLDRHIDVMAVSLKVSVRVRGRTRLEARSRIKNHSIHTRNLHILSIPDTNPYRYQPFNVDDLVSTPGWRMLYHCRHALQPSTRRSDSPLFLASNTRTKIFSFAPAGP